MHMTTPEKQTSVWAERRNRTCWQQPLRSGEPHFKVQHIIPELMSQMDLSLYLHWSPCVESPISVWGSHCSQSYLLGTSVAFLLENSAHRIKASLLSAQTKAFLRWFWAAFAVSPLPFCYVHMPLKPHRNSNHITLFRPPCLCMCSCSFAYPIAVFHYPLKCHSHLSNFSGFLYGFFSLYST